MSSPFFSFVFFCVHFCWFLRVLVSRKLPPPGVCFHYKDIGCQVWIWMPSQVRWVVLCSAWCGSPKGELSDNTPSPKFTRWWFQIFLFSPIWGKFPFWLIFFKRGWNHQLVYGYQLEWLEYSKNYGWKIIGGLILDEEMPKDDVLEKR